MPKSVYLIATVYTEKTNGADYIPSPAKKKRKNERKKTFKKTKRNPIDSCVQKDHLVLTNTSLQKMLNNSSGIVEIVFPASGRQLHEVTRLNQSKKPDSKLAFFAC